MNKKEFIEKLEKRLSRIDEIEREKTLQYYEESINDRIEDGLSEEEAVAALGDINDIVDNIMCDRSLFTLVKTKVGEIKSKTNNNTLWIILLILGFPIWFPIVSMLLFAVFMVYLGICMAMLGFIIVLVSFAGASIASFFVCFFKFATAGFATGALCLGASFILGGLAILLFEPCKEACKMMCKGTVGFLKKLKRLLIPKREA